MQTGLLTTFQSPAKTRNWVAWLIAAILTTFYVYLYFTNDLTPIAKALGLSSKWWLYSWLYTIAMLIGGTCFLLKHGKTPYQRWRTVVVVLVQVVFVMALPYAMVAFETPVYNFAVFWPLKYDTFYPTTLNAQPALYVIYSFIGALVVVPVMTFLLGKRWFCSWACGCGGLAETAGDSYRHLSDKSAKAWLFERYAIYLVLAFVIINTAVVALHYNLRADLGAEYASTYPLLSEIAIPMARFYKFWVGSMLAGVIGVGLYPLMGSRVWCRFFCPLAALMGIIQKFGRFRITVKDNMCISCGNCSTYCEMGIDVRLYAQRNEDFKRAACVGCGICAHVCPRGVLKLENKWDFGSWGDDVATHVM